MASPRNNPISAFALAKINLTLTVTGRRPDGYHELESLVAFADIGDTILLKAPPYKGGVGEGDTLPTVYHRNTPPNPPLLGEGFSFEVLGPFADELVAEENLAVRAVRLLASRLNRKPSGALTLIKNLPIASGLGGGSADAAAVLRAYCELWSVAPAQIPDFDALLLSLGADVPVCFAGAPAWMSGIGETLAPAPVLPAAAVLLINPGLSCSTAEVFRQGVTFSEPPARPLRFADIDDWIDFLNAHDNALTAPALAVVPSIGEVLAVLTAQPACALARMAGSGATCFGLFRTLAEAEQAAAEITRRKPDWWVKAGNLK